ncbi:MAG: galactose mutarotase [Eudoraea sp.]|nr:galactose mutarotase [Eudoraea sp.]
MQQVTIKNEYISLTTIPYGAIIQELLVKDKNGEATNMVTGFSSPEDYLTDTISLGACVGRFAGRISGGSIIIDGSEYPIYEEDGVHLHGGKEGFARKYWTLLEVNEGSQPYVKYGYLSQHLEEGYPGNLEVAVTYILKGNSLIIKHEANTDAPTIVNLTNHSYFRLDNEASIDHYSLRVAAECTLQTDNLLLPTGRLTPVKNTENNFLEEKAIGKTLLDTPFVVTPNEPDTVEMYSNKSGIRLRVTTNQPAIVIYTPEEFPGICFETQNYPDAPTYSSFPSSILNPGETYINESRFIFDLVP